MGTTKNWSKLRFSGRVSSFCSNSDTRRVPVQETKVSQQDIRHRLSLHVPWENHIRHRLSSHVPWENHIRHRLSSRYPFG
jgi:hypothetical protein